MVTVRSRDWATVDYYAVLGVPVNASTDEIAAAFRTLAKSLHPDRSGSAGAEAERFKLVTAAYEVLSNARLRRGYDEVRVEVGRQARLARVTTAPRPAARPAPVPTRAPRAPVPPEIARRRAWQWIAAGVVVTMLGLVVAVLVVHLQSVTSARRAGRVKARATVVVLTTGIDVTFQTAAGAVIEVPEPARVNPGSNRQGDHLSVLYRPERPTDVIVDESTAARDITLWIVAVKFLVGGIVFVALGIRRLRRTPRVPSPPSTDGAVQASAIPDA